MSTSVGTLQPKVHIGRPFVAAVVLALLAAGTIGVYTLSTSSDTETATSTTISGTTTNTPAELGGATTQVASGSILRPFGRSAVTPKVAAVAPATVLPHAKQLGLDIVATGTAAISVTEVTARNAMLASYQQTAAVSEIFARNAMLASYQQPAAVSEIFARNAMLASYQQPGSGGIIVNGEVCQICWKYR